MTPPTPDAAFLDRAWDTIASAAKRHRVAVIQGTERLVDGGLHATALVIDRDGNRLGFQDKVQIDPSEEGTHAPATTGRRVFESDGVTYSATLRDR